MNQWTEIDDVQQVIQEYRRGLRLWRVDRQQED
jgi:hypothetical protein